MAGDGSVIGCEPLVLKDLAHWRTRPAQGIRAATRRRHESRHRFAPALAAVNKYVLAWRANGGAKRPSAVARPQVTPPTGTDNLQFHSRMQESING